jgi:peptidoglycan/LPS O-acetylase OafA/YrhL
MEQAIGILLAELTAALIILSIARGEPNFRWLSSAPLVGIGRISYGVYLFHYPICFFLIPPGPWWIGFPVTLAASLLLAALSYHLVEKPIMRTFGAKRAHAGEAAVPVERPVRATANIWPGAPDKAPTPALAAAGPEPR